jgi:hypothetical protein
MSKIFYDHLIVLEELEVVIKNTAETPQEKEELWNLVDEIVHHRVLICVLDRLPIQYHQEFLGRFHEKPHDESLIDFLKEKGGQDFEEVIKKEIEALNHELLREIRRNTSE